VTRRIAVAVVVALALAAAGCGGGAPSRATGSTVAAERTNTLLIMGTSASLGDGLDDPVRLQDAWPRVFYRDAFPRATVLVNAAVLDGSTADALRDQVPLAEDVAPSVVAIWLGAVEASEKRPVNEFAADLNGVVRRTRATGARVLLADLPPVAGIDVSAYNRVIARVAEDQGATLVPLHTQTISMLPGSGSTFLPDTAGHRVIARAFQAALH
jgi:lysophospholipase L1-like esterase